jgi:hypothetical protein
VDAGVLADMRDGMVICMGWRFVWVGKGGRVMRVIFRVGVIESYKAIQRKEVEYCRLNIY